MRCCQYGIDVDQICLYVTPASTQAIAFQLSQFGSSTSIFPRFKILERCKRSDQQCAGLIGSPLQQVQIIQRH